MAMVSIGGAFSAASSFFGLGARLHPDVRLDDTGPHASEADALHPLSDGLAPGEPCFEAVARALAEAGYLDPRSRFLLD